MPRVEWLLLGLAAGALTSTAFLPQIVRGWRSRRLVDVSPLTLVTMNVGVGLWLAYGIATGDIALILANGVGLVLAGTLFGLWMKWGRRPGQGVPPPSMPAR